MSSHGRAVIVWEDLRVLVKVSELKGMSRQNLSSQLHRATQTSAAEGLDMTKRNHPVC